MPLSEPEILLDSMCVLELARSVMPMEFDTISLLIRRVFDVPFSNKPLPSIRLLAISNPVVLIASSPPPN